MDYKNLVKQYRSKLIIESLMKSIILGCLIGFAVCLGIIIGTYSMNFDGLWIGLVAFVICSALSSWGLYATLFKPDEKKIAARIDAVGLDERVITMMGNKNNDSFIAQKQRVNTQEKIVDITPKNIKMSIFKLPIAALVLLGITTTTVMIAKRPKAELPPVVERIEINDILLMVGENKVIEVAIFPIRATTTLTYSEVEVAQIIDGVIYGIKVGQADVTCTAANGVYTTFNVTVLEEEELPEVKTPEEIIGDLIDQLRDIVDNAPINDQLKADLNDRIDQAEIDLQDMPLQDQLDYLDQLEKDIHDIIEKNQEENETSDEEKQNQDELEWQMQQEIAKAAEALERVQAEEQNDEGQKFVEDFFKGREELYKEETCIDGDKTVESQLAILVRELYDQINNPETTPEQRAILEAYLESLR